MSPSAGGWQPLQGCSAATSFAWNTTGLTPGVYILDVWARDAGSGATYDTYAYTYFTVSAPCSALTVAANPRGPARAGTSVTLSATGVAGCLNPRCAYWFLPPSGVWQQLQVYTSATSVTWNTSELAPGSYILDIWARDAATGAPFYDTYAYVTFIVQ